jgi:hypothetical protein
MARTKVYVSGPISNGGTLIDSAREKNMHHAIEVGMTLIKSGYAPLIPHLTFVMDKLHGPIAQSTWMEIDLPWVRVADAILRLPGKSAGADEEVEEARALGIQVFHTVQDLIQNVSCVDGQSSGRVAAMVRRSG